MVNFVISCTHVYLLNNELDQLPGPVRHSRVVSRAYRRAMLPYILHALLVNLWMLFFYKGRTGSIHIRNPYQKSEWFVSQVACRGCSFLDANMDQDASNHWHNASQDESQDPHRMRIGRLDTVHPPLTHVPLGQRFCGQ